MCDKKMREEAERKHYLELQSKATLDGASADTIVEYLQFRPVPLSVDADVDRMIRIAIVKKSLQSNPPLAFWHPIAWVYEIRFLLESTNVEVETLVSALVIAVDRVRVESPAEEASAVTELLLAYHKIGKHDLVLDCFNQIRGHIPPEIIDVPVGIALVESGFYEKAIHYLKEEYDSSILEHANPGPEFEEFANQAEYYAKALAGAGYLAEASTVRSTIEKVQLMHKNY